MREDIRQKMIEAEILSKTLIEKIQPFVEGDSEEEHKILLIALAILIGSHPLMENETIKECVLAMITLSSEGGTM